MNVDEMQAGRELDAMIAQAMGWTRGHETETMISDDDPSDADYYEPYPIYTIFLQPPEGERVYLYSTHDLTIVRDVSEWFVLDGLLPEWSTDMASAWHVVEKLNLFAPTDDGDRVLQLGDSRLWQVWLVWYSDWEKITEADTAPLAICRAALKVAEK